MAIEPGDLVLISQHGRVFHARVQGAELAGRYRTLPLDPAVRSRSATLAEIVDHWAHAGDPRPARDRAQASFEHLLDP